MYEKVDTGLDFEKRERRVLDFWKENGVFEKSVRQREGAPVFAFYEGPPTANGMPHIGHVVTRAVKDLFPRYKTMKGYKVLRKAGWDTHGLPVELEVEKALGLNGKPDIEKFGIEPFIKKCRESVFKYQALWEEMSERVGYWADMESPYITYDNGYIESVWWALSEIYKKGLMYKSYRVVPYCPRCGTPLSSHEVAQGYRDITEDSAYVAFPVRGKENVHLLAWTTTPWTLPSNVGLCVNPAVEYAKVDAGGKLYILASGLVEGVFGDSARVVETMSGKSLEGERYEPLFDFASPGGESYCTVVCDGYVTTTDGTGIVHIAPAFGEDDSRISKACGLPFVQLVDDAGRFTADARLFAGDFVKDADPKIIAELDRRGRLVKKTAYSHSYPFCWRCDTPLLYYARDAWFISMQGLRDALVASNSEVNWLPEHMKSGRFGNFLENVIDWSISRERYWGTPLPIWECSECGHRLSVGSVKDLTDRDPGISPGIDLHRPYIDEIMLPCEKCGTGSGRPTMKRTPEVIDCWFDSGAMPFAQWHYPFENREIFEEQFPADFISEAVDQTRGWFYSLLAISTLLFGKSPYKNVVVLGLGLDENGQKMSKSKGNAVSPAEALDKHGADAVRWFLYSASSPWQNFRFGDEAVTEGKRRFLGTFWNTYAFYALYAEIDGFSPFAQHGPGEASLMDRWLASKLNTLVKEVTARMDGYDLHEAAKLLDGFTDELSNWYLRLCRKRYWAKGMTADKISAYTCLHGALVTLAKLAAPFVPFVTELVYRNLVAGLDGGAPASVHLCGYPEADEGKIDKALEAQMGEIAAIVSAGRAARNAAGIKNRQPLSKIIVALGGERAFGQEQVDIILGELNVKSAQFQSSAGEYTSYRFKPQLRALGPRYGKLVPKIAESLNHAPDETMRRLKSGGFRAEIDGTPVELAMDDVIVETTHREGFFAASEGGATVVLDTSLTQELVDEGFAREIVSKLQNMRRDAGFEVTDRVEAGFEIKAGGGTKAGGGLRGAIAKNRAAIAEETLANGVAETPPPEGAHAREWGIGGESALLWVKRA